MPKRPFSLKSPRPQRRRAAFLALLIALLAWAVTTGAGPPHSTTWLKPALQEENGRYINPVGDLLRGTAGVRIPFFWGRIKTTFIPRSGAPPAVESGSDYYLTEGGTEPTVTWIGHATLLVEMDGVRFLTDPIWSRRASPLSWMGPKRTVDPGIVFEDLPKIDFVLISHSHFDHLDLPTLERLADRDPETIFYVPLGNARLLGRRGITNVTELDWTEKVAFHGVEIHCLPAQHWSKRSLTDTDKALWSSWAVIGEKRRFYFAGDTGYFSGFDEIGRALGPFDLAAIPIGAYEPTELMRLTHMDPEQALQAAVDVRARTALAIHFGTFDLADEPLDQPPKRFLAAAKTQAEGPNASTPLETWIFSIGEIRPF